MRRRFLNGSRALAGKLHRTASMPNLMFAIKTILRRCVDNGTAILQNYVDNSIDGNVTFEAAQPPLAFK
jgi:hypothetical protein